MEHKRVQTGAQVGRDSGLRRSKIVARIAQALRRCGAEILVRADSTTAPFEFTVETPTGIPCELVCSAFTASRYRRDGEPLDRHGFQIGYGQGSDRCHQLYLDARGRKTTLLFGVHLQMALFVAVIAFRPDQFLRYVEFERLASGLDCGERRPSDRIEQSLSQGKVLTAPGGHPLELLIGIPVLDILDAAMRRIGRA